MKQNSSLTCIDLPEFSLERRHDVVPDCVFSVVHRGVCWDIFSSDSCQCSRGILPRRGNCSNSDDGSENSAPKQAALALRDGEQWWFEWLGPVKGLQPGENVASVNLHGSKDLEPIVEDFHFKVVDDE